MTKQEIFDYSEMVKNVYEKYKDSEDSLLGAFEVMADVLGSFGVPIYFGYIPPVDRSRFPKLYPRKGVNHGSNQHRGT